MLDYRFGSRAAFRVRRENGPHGTTRESTRPLPQSNCGRPAVIGAKRTLADRAEWEVVKAKDGWEVIAWRVEHPECKGPSRYLPWGYSVIELDSRLETIGYRRKG